jgi:hypothetical protein
MIFLDAPIFFQVTNVTFVICAVQYRTIDFWRADFFRVIRRERAKRRRDGEMEKHVNLLRGEP